MTREELTMTKLVAVSVLDFKKSGLGLDKAKELIEKLWNVEQVKPWHSKAGLTRLTANE